MLRSKRSRSLAALTILALLMSTGHAHAQALDPTGAFSGRSLDGWTTLDGKPAGPAWEASDGVIRLVKDGRRGGHLVTAAEYGDFDLSFEWKIAPGGNSGLKYRVRNYGGKVLGCEYQIFDDAGSKRPVAGKNSAGSLYDLYEPNDEKQLRPAGEFNSARIVVQGNRFEHWLNGKRIVVANVGDEDWTRRVKASKFNDVSDFSRNPRGKIMLTDHGSAVEYRNFRFASLDPPRQTHIFKQIDKLAIRADVYRPTLAGDSPRPVVVWIHGGALINGHRDTVPGWFRAAFLDRGYVVVSLDYRLAPETKFAAIVEDVVDGVAWVRERGPELFQADARRVAVVGGSAGGFLALVTGCRCEPRPTAIVSLWGYGDLVGPDYNVPSPHARHRRSSLTRDEAMKQAAAPPISDSRDRRGDGGAFYHFCRREGIWPQMVTGWDLDQDADKLAPLMPARQVSPHYPPTFLIHGDADTDVPFAMSRTMADQFARHGVEHRLIKFAGAEHGLVGADPQEVAAAYRAAAEFIAAQFAK